jgi:hypothetical protein
LEVDAEVFPGKKVWGQRYPEEYAADKDQKEEDSFCFKVLYKGV